MELCRVTDLNRVRAILTARDIYCAMGDDFTAVIEDFRPNDHPAIWYVEVESAGEPIGLFSLFPQNRVCWEVHVAMLPWATTREKWAAARALPGWLAEHTECKRLTAAVPHCNWPAIVYGTHGIGMRFVGRQEKAFMKHGVLQDLVLLGLSIGV